MAGFREGFVKLFTSPGTGVILGGVIVAPRASELILAVSVAMEQRLTAEQLAQTFAVYPSLSGSVTEAARKLMEFTPGLALMRGTPQVGVVGGLEPVPAQPGHPDVVGVQRDDAHAADQEQPRHRDADPRRAGQQRQHGAQRQHHDQVADDEPAPPARASVSSCLTDPLPVPLRQPAAQREQRLTSQSRVPRDPARG